MKNKRWYLVISWMIVIFIFSAMPNDLSQIFSEKATEQIKETIIEPQVTTSSPQIIVVPSEVEVEEKEEVVVQVPEVEVSKPKVNFLIRLKYFLDPTGIKTGNYFVRKFAHAFEYFILCILFVYAMSEDKKISFKMGLCSVLFCFLYACSDEFHQLFVDGRSGMFRDCLIDTTGALLGLLLVSVYYKAKYKVLKVK